MAVKRKKKAHIFFTINSQKETQKGTYQA